MAHYHDSLLEVLERFKSGDVLQADRMNNIWAHLNRLKRQVPLQLQIRVESVALINKDVLKYRQNQHEWSLNRKWLPEVNRISRNSSRLCPKLSFQIQN